MTLTDAYVPGRSFFTGMSRTSTITNHPKEFLAAHELVKRRKAAHRLVLDVFQFHQRTRYGAVGLCHEIHDLSRDPEDLVALASRREIEVLQNPQRDGYTVQEVDLEEEPLYEPLPGNRSPIITKDDVPRHILTRGPFAQESQGELVLRLQQALIRDALQELIANHEISYVGGIWGVRVSTLDRHRSATKRREKAMAGMRR